MDPLHAVYLTVGLFVITFFNPGANLFVVVQTSLASGRRAGVLTGLGVALASDYNPGSSPSGNMRMVCSLASIRMKMTPAEAINAATLNGAYAMGLSRKHAIPVLEHFDDTGVTRRVGDARELAS